MTISADLVKELRAITDAPMMECKKALEKPAVILKMLLKNYVNQAQQKRIKKQAVLRQKAPS